MKSIFGFGILLTLAFLMSACSQQRREPATARAASLAVRVHFRFDSAVVSDEERHRLALQADLLKRRPGQIAQLEGHADAVGSRRYNVWLGDQRARAVKAVLIEKGVDAQQLLILSFGEDRPIVSNETEEGRAENRRVDVNIR